MIEYKELSYTQGSQRITERKDIEWSTASIEKYVQLRGGTNLKIRRVTYGKKAKPIAVRPSIEDHEFKVCTCCGQRKHRSEFYNIPRRPGKTRARCKSCDRLANMRANNKRIPDYAQQCISCNQWMEKSAFSFKEDMTRNRKCDKCRHEYKKPENQLCN